MSKNVLQVAVRKDEDLKKLRANKKIPAVVYGPKVENRKIILDDLQFRKMFSAVGESQLIDLKIGEETIPVLIHEIQTDPVRDDFLHIDFFAVEMGKTLTTRISIVLTGTSPAVKNFGGILMHAKNFVEVKCLPRNLIAEVVVDVSNLENLHDKIAVSDLPKFDGIEVLDNPELTIVTVTAPKGSSDEEEKTEEESGESKEDAEKVDDKKEEKS
jgi:large subunit ribosomal protein L25